MKPALAYTYDIRVIIFPATFAPRKGIQIMTAINFLIYTAFTYTIA